MMKWTLIVLALFSLGNLPGIRAGNPGCGYPDTLILEGFDKAKAFKLCGKDFNKVDIQLKQEYSFWGSNSGAKIFLAQSDRDAVYIITPDKYKKYIDAEVNDGKLEIEKDENFDIEDENDLIIYIEVRNLNEINVDGVAEIRTVKQLRSNDLSINLDGVFEVKMSLDVTKISADINGVFDVNFKGKAVYANFDINGIGDFNSTKLITEHLDSDVSGIGEAGFYASESANSNASGLGSVFIKGKPKKMSRNVSGIGSFDY